MRVVYIMDEGMVKKIYVKDNGGSPNDPKLDIPLDNNIHDSESGHINTNENSENPEIVFRGIDDAEFEEITEQAMQSPKPNKSIIQKIKDKFGLGKNRPHRRSG